MIYVFALLCIYSICDLQQLSKSCKQLKCEDRLMETGDDLIKSSLPSLTALLVKALGNRVHLLDVRLIQNKQVSDKSSASQSKNTVYAF